MAFNVKEQKLKRKAISPFAIVIAILVCVVSISVGVWAKYVAGFTSSYKQTSVAEFYFLTNLTPNTSTQPYPVYDGSIDFDVKNNDALNISQTDITYTVSVEKLIDGTVDTLVTQPLIQSTPGERVSKHISYAVSADGDYKVSIASTSPFEKEIVLFFRVNTHYGDSYYTITEHTDGWFEVDVFTGEDSGNVIVNYNGVQPDNTLALMADWTTASAQGTLSGLVAFGHYKLIFFGEYNSTCVLLKQNGKTLAKGE